MRSFLLRLGAVILIIALFYVFIWLCLLADERSPSHEKGDCRCCPVCRAYEEYGNQEEENDVISEE